MRMLLIAGLLLVAVSAQAATTFWRPVTDGHCRGSECDGQTYETAWRIGTEGAGNDLERVQLATGDTLMVCGTHYSHPVNIIVVRVDGVTVTGDCPGRPGVIVGGYVGVAGAEDVTVEDLTVIGTSYGNLGVTATSVKGLTLQRLHVREVAMGILVNSKGVVPAEDVVIQDSRIEKVGQGILFKADSSSPAKDVVVRKNLIQKVQDRVDRVDYDAEGIGFMGCDGCTVEDNQLIDQAYGIHVWACHDAVFRNVVIRGNRVSKTKGGTPSWPGWGIFSSCSVSDSHENILVEGNTVNVTPLEGIRIAVGENSQNVMVRNNVVLNYDRNGVGAEALWLYGNIATE